MGIVITDRQLGRTLYIIIILVLAVLLVFSYLKDCDCENVEAEATTPPAATVNDTENETTPVVTATCNDTLKNQDETDVDCGGDVCDPCAEGKDCTYNRDCEEGHCEAGVCNATADLSGTFIFTINEVEFEENPSNDVPKVTAITVTVENGLSTAKDVTLDIYAQSVDGFRNLNQLDETGTPKTYAKVELPPLVAGGKLTSQRYELSGLYTASSYIYDLTEYWEAGDDFRIQVKAIDEDTGDTLETVNKKVVV